MMKIVKKIVEFWKFIKWMEEQRIKAAIHTCSAGPLM